MDIQHSITVAKEPDPAAMAARQEMRERREKRTKAILAADVQRRRERKAIAQAKAKALVAREVARAFAS